MKKIILIILDGWGLRYARTGNAIHAAPTPTMHALWKTHPHTALHASGEHVGLFPGNMGNSEVGHVHLGAGRLVTQDARRISNAINNGTFFKNKVLLNAMRHTKKTGKTLHLLGLLSDANVHANIHHLFALLKMAHQHKIPSLYIHAFLDGRDTPPQSALLYIKMTERELKKYNPHWKIATLTGRYYAMDRDNRWTRQHHAYNVMVECKGYHYASAEEALTAAYNRGETDEFVHPSIVAGDICAVKNGDTVIFYNFRSDRARQITKAFTQHRFTKFKRKKISRLSFICMTQYDPDIKAAVVFPPLHLRNTLGEVLSHHKFKQFRLAETEKWAHVTYFFNGLSGKIFFGEKRLLVPSPPVRTYDQQPAMSAREITTEAIRQIQSKKYPFILINYANADMVGHTGNYRATITAIKTIDECLATIIPIACKENATLLITADHGNAEQMQYPDGTPCTAHTTNQVPFILISNENVTIKKNKNFALYNIAPTILDLYGIKKPKEMTAESMIKRHHDQ